MRALLLSIAVLAAGCEKTTAPGPEPQKVAPAPSASTPAQADPMPADSVTKPIAKGSNDLAFDLWQKMSAKTPGNATFSPASISLALAMTHAGARGQTASQMEKTLHFGDPANVASSWGALSKGLTSTKRPLRLRIANRLFGEKTYTFDQGFLGKMTTSFGPGAIELVDFKKSPEPVRNEINAWVEKATEQRIKDLLPPPAVNESTRLVLVNAIYFLADWETEFEKTSTYDADFSTSAATKKKVATMHTSGRQFRIAQGEGARLLELPYKGKSASMVFVLPDKVDGLAALEKSMSAEKLSKWISELKAPSEKVLIALPRFELAPPAIALAEHLASLGMTDAFDAGKADFSGMSAEKGLAIGTVVHKAFVKVDEKGTEAAAATAVAMAGAGADMSKPIEFLLDHPFLFLIVDRSSDLILFMGRVTDPSVPS